VIAGLRGLLLSVVGSVLLLGGCVEAQGPTETASRPLTREQTHESVRLDVESYDFWFKPKQLTVAPGADVEVELENDGKVAHTLSIPAAGFEIKAFAGHATEGTFSAPALVGWMSYFCRYSDNMKGRIYVGGGDDRAESMGASSPIDPGAERSFKRFIGKPTGYGLEFDPSDCDSLLCYRREARGY
jgi:plastocyanin